MIAIAIPFAKGGFIDFWNIVKIDESKYREALLRNPYIIRLDVRSVANSESILKAEKTRLLREQWTTRKSMCAYRISRAEKVYKTEMAKTGFQRMAESRSKHWKDYLPTIVL